MRLIGICGFSGAGKSELARALCEHHGYTEVAFADPLKELVCEAFSLPREWVYSPVLKETLWPAAGTTPRVLLQRFGTEIGRDGKMAALEDVGLSPERALSLLGSLGVSPGKDCWIQAWRNRIQQIPRVVTPDVRFLNEGEAITQQGGVLLRVVRPSLVRVSDHESERYASLLPVAGEIYNTGGLSQFVIHAQRADRLAGEPQ